MPVPSRQKRHDNELHSKSKELKTRSNTSGKVSIRIIDEIRKEPVSKLANLDAQRNDSQNVEYEGPAKEVLFRDQHAVQDHCLAQVVADYQSGVEPGPHVDSEDKQPHSIGYDQPAEHGTYVRPMAYPQITRLSQGHTEAVSERAQANYWFLFMLTWLCGHQAW